MGPLLPRRRLPLVVLILLALRLPPTQCTQRTVSSMTELENMLADLPPATSVWGRILPSLMVLVPEGDHISVRQGLVVNESKDVDVDGKGWTLSGAGSRLLTVLAGSTLRASNLTFAYGNAKTDPSASEIVEADAPETRGGGVYIQGGGADFRGCQFLGNTAATYGGAAFVEGTSANRSTATTMSSCTFSNNTGNAGTGGMAVARGSQARVVGCYFSENKGFEPDKHTQVGAGLELLMRSSATVTESTFKHNKVRKASGSVKLRTNAVTRVGDFSTANLSSCTWEGQHQHEDHSRWVCLASSGNGTRIRLTRSTFTTNVAQRRPGAANGVSNAVLLFAVGTAYDLRHVLFRKNVNEIGKGILVVRPRDHSSAHPDIHEHGTLSSCTFTSNTAKLGGAVYLARFARVSFQGCAFERCKATKEAVQRGDWGGGAVLLDNLDTRSHESLPSAMFHGCSFVANEVIGPGGGVMLVGKGVIELHGCTFLENKGLRGPALYLLHRWFEGESNTYRGSANVSTCGFFSNNASTKNASLFLAAGRGLCNHAAMSLAPKTAATLTSCDFSSNRATWPWGIQDMHELATDPEGAGLRLDDAHAVLSNCTFKSNSALKGAGLVIFEAATAEVTRCTFEANTHPDPDSFGASSRPVIGGCAVFLTVDGSLGTFTSCEFSSNRVTRDKGGALYLNLKTTAHVVNCVFQHNMASDRGEAGGAIYVTKWSISQGPERTLLNVTGVKFERNSAQEGGALGLASSMTANLRQCRFLRNVATGHGGTDDHQGGGALYGVDARVAVAECFFEHQRAMLGGVFMLKNEKAEVRSTITRCSFASNTAEMPSVSTPIRLGNGGVFWVRPECPAHLKDTCGSIHDPNLRVDECHFVGSKCAYRGGSVYVSRRSSCVLNRSSFENNAASGKLVASGGALALAEAAGLQQILVHQCLFTSNAAARNGGAVAIVKSNMATFQSCRFAWNRAEGMGGGVWVWQDADLTLQSSTFLGCSAGTHGGAIALRDVNRPSVVVEDAAFEGNWAPVGESLALLNSSWPGLPLCASLARTMVKRERETPLGRLSKAANASECCCPSPSPDATFEFRARDDCGSCEQVKKCSNNFKTVACPVLATRAADAFTVSETLAHWWHDGGADFDTSNNGIMFARNSQECASAAWGASLERVPVCSVGHAHPTWSIFNFRDGGTGDEGLEWRKEPLNDVAFSFRQGTVSNPRDLGFLKKLHTYDLESCVDACEAWGQCMMWEFDENKTCEVMKADFSNTKTNCILVSADAGMSGDLTHAPGVAVGCRSTEFACCRHCESSKACGDTCISTDATCSTPDGCACNGTSPSSAQQVAWRAAHQCALLKNVVSVAKCSKCPPGRGWSFDASSGRSVCKGCQAGEYPFPPSGRLESCRTCDPGRYCPEGQSSPPCPVGKHQALPGATACVACKPGDFAPTAGLSVCEACPTGTYRDDAAAQSSECNACGAGTFSSRTGANVCDVCPPGAYMSGTGAEACTQCPQGHRTAIVKQQRLHEKTQWETTQCTACAVGTYQQVTGQTVCKVCARGTFTEASGTATCSLCDTCEVGYSVNLSQTCSPSKGGIAPPPENSTAEKAVPRYCTACPAGTYGDFQNLGDCKRCPAGYVSRQAQSFSCEMCTPGQHVNESGASLCLDCPSKTAQPAPGKSVCRDCEQGEVSLPGSTECEYCPEGFRSHADGRCEHCKAGTYAPSIKEPACRLCDAGQYQNTTGKSSCRRCQVGQAQAELGQSACLDCGPGLHANAPGFKKCRPCETQYEFVAQRTGASACLACAANAIVLDRPGHPLRHRTCHCKPGFYQPMLGLGSSEIPNATDASSLTCDVQAAAGPRRCCRPCPAGSTCDARTANAGDATFDFEGRLATAAGYWRDRDWRTMNALTIRDDDGEFFLPCTSAEVCPGTMQLLRRLRIASIAEEEEKLRRNTTLPLHQDVNNRTRNGTGTNSSIVDASVLSLSLGTLTSQCRQGHTGVTCASCSTSWSPDAAGLCVNCEEDSDGGGGKGSLEAKLGVLFGVSAFVWVTLTILLTTKSAGGRDDMIRTNEMRETVGDAREALGQASMLGQTLSRLGTLAPIMQRIVALDDVFATLAWPPVMTVIVRWMKVLVMQVGSLLAFVSPCALHVDIEEELYIALFMLPWFVVIAFAAKIGASRMMAYQRWRKSRGKRRAERKLARFERRRNKLQSMGEAKDKDRSGATEGEEGGGGGETKTPETHSVRQEEYSARVRLLAIGMLVAKLAHPGVSAQLLLFGVCQDVGEDDHTRVMAAAVDVECVFSDSTYTRVVAISIVGIVLITAGLPLVLAAMIYRDHTRFVVEEAKHAKEAEDEMHHDALNIWHVSTPQERLAARVHRWTAARTARLERLRHRSINWIVSKWKPEMWWWFIVEMLFSLVLISILQLASGALWKQYYTALITAAVQTMLPALVRPHMDRADDWVAIAGAALYFLLVVGRMPRYLVDLELNDPDFKAESHAASVRGADMLLDVTFILGLVMMAAVVSVGTLRHGRCPRRYRRYDIRRFFMPFKRRTAVLPVRASKKELASASASTHGANKIQADGETSITLGGEEEKGGGDVAGTVRSGTRTSGPATRGARTQVVGVAVIQQPKTFLRRCRGDLLRSVNPALKKRYDVAWATLEHLQEEVMATAIQAAARGRRGRTNVVHMLAEVGRTSRLASQKSQMREMSSSLLSSPASPSPAGHSTKSFLFRRANTTSALPAPIRRRPSKHRQLRHNQLSTQALLEAATAFTDKTAAGQAHGGKATALLLKTAETFTAAELSGLHEEKRLSDNQIVAILRARHEAEHAEYRAALADEAETQKAKARKRSLKRGFLHHFKASKLADADLVAAFKTVDRDSSGLIDVEELIEVYRTVFKRQLSKVEATELMRAADQDGDSETMTMDELKGLLMR